MENKSFLINYKTLYNINSYHVKHKYDTENYNLSQYSSVYSDELFKIYMCHFTFSMPMYDMMKFVIFIGDRYYRFDHSNFEFYKSDLLLILYIDNFKLYASINVKNYHNYHFHLLEKNIDIKLFELFSLLPRNNNLLVKDEIGNLII